MYEFQNSREGLWLDEKALTLHKVSLRLNPWHVKIRISGERVFFLAGRGEPFCAGNHRVLLSGREENTENDRPVA